ncbi:MAG: DUF3187 family protein [Candidatus Omnitrophica bacterium]|nr:DUF3187 family protein [Candidatus Omnitrophota bacterium]
MRSRFIIIAAVIALLGLAPRGFAYERVNPAGPMPIRNQMPLYLFWYSFSQDKADVLKGKKFVATFDYTVSNVIVDKVTTPTEEYIVRADMEVTRLNCDIKYAFLERFEASLEVPYLILNRGYLDTFVEHFEQAIGATAVGARRRADKDQFNYQVIHNNDYLIDTQRSSAGLGDIALALKYMLLEEMNGLPRISARAAVKFPTASKKDYLGTGKIDYGIGILADKSFGRFFTYLNLNSVFIQKPDFLSELNIKNYILSGMLGLEYCFTERFSGILQGTLASTPYPKTGTDPLDNKAGEAGLGLNYQLTMNSNWHIAVVENLFADSTPDVTFQLGGNIKF